MEDHPYLISKGASSLEKIFSRKQSIFQPDTIKFLIYFSIIRFVILAFISAESTKYSEREADRRIVQFNCAQNQTTSTVIIIWTN